MTFRASAMGDDAKPLSPGWFSYRVLSASGRASKSEIVSFDESERQGLVFVKTIQHKFSVPLPAMGGAGGGSPALGGVAQGAATGLAPGAGGGSGGGRPQAAGSFAGNGTPAPPNVHADSLWVDVTGGKSGSVQKSGYANCSVTCQTATTQIPVGGLSAGADPQRPPPPPRGLTQPGAGPGVVQVPPATVQLPGASPVPSRPAGATPSTPTPPAGVPPTVPPTTPVPPAGVPTAPLPNPRTPPPATPTANPSAQPAKPAASAAPVPLARPATAGAR